MRHDLVLTGIISVGTSLVLGGVLGFAWTSHHQTAPVVVVDVQKLISDEQEALLKTFNNGDPVHMTDDAKNKATQHAGDYAKRLSAALDQLGAECGCVVVNKAAVLAGAAPDLTDQVSRGIAK
ncbi:TrbI F-type domain-containing protein [Burkholderia gladioli]|nr:TrbI F-type domain-containing protein [Burkholderia gladioli]MBU9193041.1 type-F conjugative transfer system protein TrbI [Burkholderia gladioli]MBW5287305.1 TrbI F-type domain-containing protein [Burkholderia gladioli]MDC6130589.1 TrbI F-type domain-containing protein [Burkholderia gladioli]MDN7466301.1 TrbI F-type domain-containing protein [Burkholderia gladioli]MDN7812860.1 TrbI F-type domain-containing protein [Burkholderia gladioli]